MLQCDNSTHAWGVFADPPGQLGPDFFGFNLRCDHGPFEWLSIIVGSFHGEASSQRMYPPGILLEFVAPFIVGTPNEGERWDCIVRLAAPFFGLHFSIALTVEIIAIYNQGPTSLATVGMILKAGTWPV